MSLQLVFGGSGSGKSTYIFNEVISKSLENPNSNYIVIVPEQYTMSTQRKLVESHPNKGILNIDVVSFERLAFKVFAEMGGENRPVLDDTGKNLVLRKVLEDSRKELRYYGANIGRVGFVAELKSVISELLQYDHSPSEILELSEKMSDNALLSTKLHDIGIVYDRFKQYLHDNYITSEEILDVCCEYAGRSHNLANSELVFDGFTGFTPIQYKLIRILLQTSRRVTVTVTVDVRERVNVQDGVENLFFMSKEMTRKLTSISDDVFGPGARIEEVKLDDSIRFRSDELKFLEKNIFRGRYVRYKKADSADRHVAVNLHDTSELKNDMTSQNSGDIHIYNGKTCKEEIQYAAGEIIRLTRYCGYRYKDIAIVSGDMSQYGVTAYNILAQNNIPTFLDAKKPVTDNPLVELIRGALEVIYKNYSYDSMFRYLRSGLTGITREETDILENYCLATGIHGSAAWQNEWKRKGMARNGFDLTALNELRRRIAAPLYRLGENLKSSKSTVHTKVLTLYEFMEELGCYETLMNLARDNDSESEYKQIYEKTIGLLDKMVELLGEQAVNLSEFNKIVDSGFSEIKVGLIPAVSDCVVVGDIERTRLDDIKVLFFLGLNEGIVPKKNDSRGVLSEADRECLERMQIAMSDSARKKAFVQRMYLYLILTKPSEQLYLSFSNKGGDGAGLLPSYLIRTIRQMFPELTVTDSSDASGQLSYIRIPKAELNFTENQFMEDLGETLALSLYGGELRGSVSSFEMFTGCMFSYFLRAGLKLEERDEYNFEAADFGTIMHAVIENVCVRLKNDGVSLSSLSDDRRREMADAALDKITRDYADDILFDSSRNKFVMEKMSRLADKTLWALGKHLEAGSFAPDEFEHEFVIDREQIALDEGFGRMLIRGKIDRVDICEDDDNVYVRVIDYKTGNSQFDLLKTYYGIKMQLVTYLHAAMELEGKKHAGKRIIPAGIYYYNLDDPILDVDMGYDDQSQAEDSLDNKVLDKLRMQGITNSDENIIKMTDSFDSGKSLVVQVDYKSGGEISKTSKVFDTEQFLELSRYMSLKMKDVGKQILSGHVGANPYADGQRTSCDYCPYSAVCAFRSNVKTHFRYIKKFDDEILWDNIEKGVDENGKQMD